MAAILISQEDVGIACMFLNTSLYDKDMVDLILTKDFDITKFMLHEQFFRHSFVQCQVFLSQDIFSK